jgi:hypothetical protein
MARRPHGFPGIAALIALLRDMWDFAGVLVEVVGASYRGELDDLPEPGVAVPPSDPEAARRWHEERGLSYDRPESVGW